jgi:glycosyltransferase involved in cell wall biosynthesis
MTPIWHLIDASGDTAYFRSIARHHDRERFPVTIGSLAPAGPLQEAMRAHGVPTFSLDAPSRAGYGGALWRLMRALRRARGALLHAHCFDPTWLGLAAARLAGRPFVFTRHHSDHHLRLGKRWHTRVDAFCAARADGVIAVSEATRRIVLDVEGASRARVTVVHNGIDPMPRPSAGEIEDARRGLEVGASAVCLVPARLHEEKGHRTLLEALPAVVKRCGHVAVLFAGAGPERERLQAEVLARGLEGTVRILGQRADMPALLALSWLVVLPSLAESFGLAALEASSAGVPVVASDAGGLPEVVAHERTGLITPRGDAAALAEAVSRVILDAGLRKRFGEEGQRRAAGFSAARMVQGYEGVYAAVLEARQGAA